MRGDSATADSSVVIVQCSTLLENDACVPVPVTVTWRCSEGLVAVAWGHAHACRFNRDSLSLGPLGMYVLHCVRVHV